ncbi:hypothetical protein GE107_04515 [Cohnella sp. CFH 77786]|uniref:hypothetical protein n=1 Tax=Cohnella sp. CFH 77786 TaxID=2662265 RepID=UPI001C60EF54|nr:hypothetical protein [Cohnella sp. CFH 77786]MBW5445324.1 hypothetical protein [Cohnella sp. CFH 77786]
MMGKLILLMIIYAGIGLADRARLSKLGSRELAAYAAMLLLSLYLGIDYVFDLKWPFLEDAAKLVFGKFAGWIVKGLTVSS